MPTARAVQRRGTATSKTGSLLELQLNARRAPTGISHSRIKFAKPAFPEKPRKRNMRKHIKRGIRTGRLTISTKPNIQRDNPNPPGLIILPRKN
jgi:hypothetical protein